MDRTIKFFTDTATLAVFDPQRLDHRVNDDVGWWCGKFSQLDEVCSGAIALVSLGSDGIYQARITNSELSAVELDYASEAVSYLGVEIVSGKLFVGPGECLPGGESGFQDENNGRGLLCDVEDGRYRVDVYSIYWFNSPRWWTEDDQTPDDAPADFVVRIRRHDGAIPALNSEPRFSELEDSFLFESTTREIGPRAGMTLRTKVRKNVGGDLTLKDCGPCSYSASLVDYSQVAWKDVVRFKVVDVNHDSKHITGELIDVISETRECT